MGARGTLGDAITFQKRNQGTIVREKPIPKDPYSLAQAYQRWDYLDYAYLWTLQSEAIKQSYRTRASRYHITGFNLWMGEHLRDLADIAGRWHLDEQSGGFAFDSSKNNNTGTIFGATPTPGLIDYCRLFDGINDYINCGNDPSLNLDEEFSLEARFKGTFAPLGLYYIVAKRAPPDVSYYLGVYLQRLRGIIYWPTGQKFVQGTIPLQNDTWYTGIFSTKSGEQLLFLGNQLDNSGVQAYSGINISSTPVIIGAGAVGTTNRFPGPIDEVVLRTRTMDINEAAMHSERRYPA